MRTEKSREGVLIVDHRASPGLPEDIARKAGYDPDSCKEGDFYEVPTLTCSHCKVSFVKNPLRVRERGHCYSCHHYVCDICAVEMKQPFYDHLPFNKFIDISAEYAIKTGQPLGANPNLILPKKEL